MTRRITVLAAIAGFVTTAELARAQPANPVPFRKDMVASGVLMQPLGDFRRALQMIGYGGGFHGLFAVGSGPMSAGVDSQLMFYAPDGRNRDMMLTAHGLVRLRQRLGPRRPYAEALGGIKGFSAEADTRIGTFSYGVGAGMQFPLGRITSEGRPEQEVVEIGVRYLRGGGARVSDRTFTSSTHAVMLHVGWGLQY
jgi:hypothetical protein